MRKGAKRTQLKEDYRIKGKTREIDSKGKSLLCATYALEKKARDLIILDVRKISSFADFFVICSGKSDRQVQAIAKDIEMNLKKKRIRPNHIEGLRAGQWVLMDYNDVIVHIFYEPLRQFYDLEGLWCDAPALEVQEKILNK